MQVRQFQWLWERSVSRRELWLVVVWLVAFVALVAPGLSRSLWHDEIVTVEMFAMLPTWGEALGHYPYPNNHLLHTALVRLALVAGESEVLIRLPALLAGCLAIVCLYALLRHLAPPWLAGLLMVLASLSLPLFGYSQHARGYTLLMAFSGLALLAWWRYLRTKRWRWLVTTWVAAALAAYAVPPGALVGAALGVAMAGEWVWRWQDGEMRRGRLGWKRAGQELGVAIGAGLLVVLAYLPVMDELMPTMKSHAGVFSVEGWLEPLAALTRLPLPLALALLVVGAFLLWRRDRQLALPAVLLALLPLLATAVMGSAPMWRVMTFMLPALWLLLAMCGVWVLDRLPAAWPGWASAGVLVVAGVIWIGPGFRQVRQAPTGALAGMEEDWKDAVAAGVTAGQEAAAVQFRAMTWSPVGNTCISPYVHGRSWLEQALYARQAAVLAGGLEGEVTVADVAFRNIWNKSLDVPAAVRFPAAFVVAEETVSEFGVARIGQLTLAVPPIQLSQTIPMDAVLNFAAENPHLVASLTEGICRLENRGEEAETLELTLPVLQPHPPGQVAAVSMSMMIRWAADASLQLPAEGFARWGKADEFRRALSPNGQASILTSGVTLKPMGSAALVPAQLSLPTGPTSAVSWVICEPDPQGVKGIFSVLVPPGSYAEFGEWTIYLHRAPAEE